MRLDKFLAHHLGISRTIVGKELKAKKVTVDGEIIKSGAYQLTPQQQVEYDGYIITPVSYTHLTLPTKA